ncbi:MAG: TlpA disulfide reductase family protein [Haliscomenobacter sp.]|uniref:TlpA family protein disulfide reductase n=1 Tax=Haliscomenobacter sp. TaxID=2717303 RepID=UPI0029AFCE12|nr:TlpA disulfide reductase family protein [Haliscomenobacter sp.]MDX2069061.1 TlpA disulfide reductase family protein [Haliscomenobacter sp.]
MKKHTLLTLAFIAFGLGLLDAQSDKPTLLSILLKPDTTTQYGAVSSVFSNLKDNIPLKGIPESLEHTQLKFFTFNPAQHHYDRFRKGLLSKEQFDQWFKRLKFDSSHVREQFFKHTTYVLAALDAEGHKVLIFDLNQNLDFSDEETMRFDTTFYSLPKEEQEKKLAKLPQITFQYEYVDQFGKLKLKKQKMSIDPNRRFFSEYPTKIDQALELAYRYNQWEKGEVREGGITKTVYVRNSVNLPAPYQGSIVTLLVPPNHGKPVPQDYYKPGDTLLIGPSRYVFTRISTFADTLFLEKLERIERPIGDRVGFYAGEVQMMALDSSSINLNDLLKKGQYVILDYWGTWCKPCIAKLPAIKKLHKTIAAKPVQMISVAYDDNFSEVKKFVTAQQMDWLNVFEPMDNKSPRQASPVKTFKVTRFPTFILIQPDGKIISTDFDEIMVWAETL